MLPVDQQEELMRGTRRFGWLTTAAVAAGLAVGSAPASAASTFVQASGTLSDLQPATANATDGATASLWAVAAGGDTTFVLFVRGLDPAAVGTTYGVHIHVGPCVAGDGAAAGPHYNSDGGVATTENEVWLDFTVRAGGYGVARTTVPFTIEAGDAQSMVVHVQPTQHGGSTPGAAGARQACLPVQF
jgi:Cu/Zn superoxide dismutase